MPIPVAQEVKDLLEGFALLVGIGGQREGRRTGREMRARHQLGMPACHEVSTLDTCNLHTAITGAAWASVLALEAKATIGQEDGLLGLTCHASARSDLLDVRLQITYGRRDVRRARGSLSPVAQPPMSEERQIALLCRWLWWDRCHCSSCHVRPPGGFLPACTSRAETEQSLSAWACACSWSGQRSIRPPSLPRR